LNVNSVGRSFLRCGKDRVSIFFGAAAQYIEVDGKLARWNVAIPPIGGGKSTGFAVTEAGRSFVNVLSFSEPDNAVTHGLYELRAKTGISVATLVPVDGTLTTHERGGVFPDETLDRLWGADGDELVVHRYEDGWGISWARVSASPSPLSSVIGNLKSRWTSMALIGTWATIFFSSLTGLLAQPKMCGTVARRPFQKPGGRL